MDEDTPYVRDVRALLGHIDALEQVIKDQREDKKVLQKRFLELESKSD